MSSLIEAKITEIDVVNAYEDLKQSCHTARYLNYEVGKDRVEMAMEAIEMIRLYCVNR